MSVTLDLEQVKQKVAAYDTLSKELYATQNHVSPLLQGMTQFLEQALVDSKKADSEAQTIAVLTEAFQHLKNVCQKSLQEFKASGDICRGKSEAYGEILAAHNLQAVESKNLDQSEKL